MNVHDGDGDAADSVLVVGPRNVDVRDKRDRREGACLRAGRSCHRHAATPRESGAGVAGDQAHGAEISSGSASSTGPSSEICSSCGHGAVGGIVNLVAVGISVNASTPMVADASTIILASARSNAVARAEFALTDCKIPKARQRLLEFWVLFFVEPF